MSNSDSESPADVSNGSQEKVVESDSEKEVKTEDGSETTMSIKGLFSFSGLVSISLFLCVSIWCCFRYRRRSV